jgi:hypothetical protein
MEAYGIPSPSHISANFRQLLEAHVNPSTPSVSVIYKQLPALCGIAL